MRLASRVVRLVAAPLAVAPSPLALPAATDVSDYFPTFTIEAHTDASYRVRWRQGRPRRGWSQGWPELQLSSGARWHFMTFMLRYHKSFCNHIMTIPEFIPDSYESYLNLYPASPLFYYLTFSTPDILLLLVSIET